MSHTSRPPRKKEENGQDYHFLSHDQFEEGVLTVRLYDEELRNYQPDMKLPIYSRRKSKSFKMLNPIPAE